MLIDRDDELEHLARRAGDRVSVRLIAPRRFGKTSVLVAHAERLRETGWRSVHVDLSRVATAESVFVSLLDRPRRCTTATRCRRSWSSTSFRTCWWLARGWTGWCARASSTTGMPLPTSTPGPSRR
jgi:hypothetical protein